MRENSNLTPTAESGDASTNEAGGLPVHGSGPEPSGELLERFLARLIDSVIVGVASGVVVALLPTSGLLTYLISGLVTSAAYLGYFGYLESKTGQGLGKRLMKLRVQAPDGGLPTFEQAVKRNLWTGAPILFIVPILGPLAAGLIELAASVVCAVNISSGQGRQTWFDRLAGGTRVVKDDTSGPA